MFLSLVCLLIVHPCGGCMFTCNVPRVLLAACNVISQSPEGSYTMVIPQQHRNCSFSIIYPVEIDISEFSLGHHNFPKVNHCMKHRCLLHSNMASPHASPDTFYCSVLSDSMCQPWSSSDQGWSELVIGANLHMKAAAVFVSINRD